MRVFEGSKWTFYHVWKSKISFWKNFFFQDIRSENRFASRLKIRIFKNFFFTSSRAPQKLPKKSVWRNPSINFDLVYLILYLKKLFVHNEKCIDGYSRIKNLRKWFESLPADLDPRRSIWSVILTYYFLKELIHHNDWIL